MNTHINHFTNTPNAPNVFYYSFNDSDYKNNGQKNRGSRHMRKLITLAITMGILTGCNGVFGTEKLDIDIIEYVNITGTYDAVQLDGKDYVYKSNVVLHWKSINTKTSDYRIEFNFHINYIDIMGGWSAEHTVCKPMWKGNEMTYTLSATSYYTYSHDMYWEAQPIEKPPYNTEPLAEGNFEINWEERAKE